MREVLGEICRGIWDIIRVSEGLKRFLVGILAVGGLIAAMNLIEKLFGY